MTLPLPVEWCMLFALSEHCVVLQESLTMTIVVRVNDRRRRLGDYSSIHLAETLESGHRTYQPQQLCPSRLRTSTWQGFLIIANVPPTTILRSPGGSNIP